MESLITSFATHFTYLGVVMLLVGGGFGLPIPEDLPLLLGGYLCSEFAPTGAQASLWYMIPVALATVIGTDYFVFYMGRKLGPRITSLPILGRHLTEERLAKARGFLADHGGKSLFIARFMPGLRSVAFASAGALHVPGWKMLVFDGSAALISVPTLVLLGWYFADVLERVRIWISQAQVAAIAALVAIVLVVVALKLLRRRRHAEGTESEAAAVEAPADRPDAAQQPQPSDDSPVARPPQACHVPHPGPHPAPRHASPDPRP